MKSSLTTPTTIDEYIATCESSVQVILKQLRQTIRKAAPDATEKLSYQMPTFYLNGNLAHFAAYQNHIGFYPTPSGIFAFHDELKSYKTSKGAVQFPIDKPLPLKLIKRMIEFRVEENSMTTTKKKKHS